MNVRTNLLLPRDLVEEVDHFAGPRGRSRYVAEALEARLKRDRLREAVRDAAGIWKDHPLFPTSEAVVEWVRAMRAEVTDPGPEGEDATDAGHDVRDRPASRRSGRNRSVRPVR